MIFRVLVWTVNIESVALKLAIENKVDGIITDFPIQFSQLFNNTSSNTHQQENHYHLSQDDHLPDLKMSLRNSQWIELECDMIKLLFPLPSQTLMEGGEENDGKVSDSYNQPIDPLQSGRVAYKDEIELKFRQKYTLLMKRYAMY